MGLYRRSCGEPMNDTIGDLFPAGLDGRHWTAAIECAQFGYPAAPPAARKIIEGKRAARSAAPAVILNGPCI